ncbi:carboxypeptidase regulatory-like domain-containing protein [Candidatus Parabeggiatoa sp. HSG14]|uniref:carboxypeptidase regulatory-like domain-containing protein n=1 Tax=Candidatus Parabeggiatoa sp. HSG14 TaxID=3055593 RepID=UPI0025A8DFEF|nr:carboxypeptidase regulatory-like domain-containing protein [Thiotrichales bacterium HSG14]
MKHQKFQWPARILAVLSLLLTTSAWAYTVTGCFIDINSNGVAGLTVSATGDTANTGNDGCFTMANVAAGTNSLTMSGSGYKSQNFSFATVSANTKSANIGRKYVIAATNGYKIHLNVLDHATNEHLNGVNFMVNTGTIQVDSGDYVLSVSEPGSYSLTATKANYDSVSVSFSVSDASPVTNRGTIKLWGGGYQVTGKVVNGDGNPVSGTQVSLNTGDSTTTASDGTFTIGGIQTSTSFTLTATKSGYTQATKNSYVNNSNPVRNMGNIAMIAGGYKVIGRVVDIDKNPLSGVSMNVNVGGTATTGNDGQFEVTGIMEPASFILTGTKSGYKDINRNSSVSQGSPVRNMGDIYLIADQSGFRVSGCVKDAGGNGMPNVEITIGNETKYTGNDGCYNITLDNAGSYNLTAKVAQDIQIPNPRQSGQTITAPKDSFSTITRSVRLSESSPIVTVSPCIFSPHVRLGLQASSSVVVENSDLVYTVTVSNTGNAPFIWAEMWSEPELPNCWSFVSGTTGNPLQAIEKSTRPLPPYPLGINTPLNCNLSNDNGHANMPYPRLGSNPAATPFLVSYPFNGNSAAKILECKELGMLGAGENTKVQVVVHAGCSGSGSGSGGSGGGSSNGGSGSGPFVLNFGAKATPLVVKFNADGTPVCPNGCNSGNNASSPIVLPKPLPKLNVVLTSAIQQVRLGDGNPLSYTLTVSNQATDMTVATGVTFSLVKPAEVTMDSVTIDNSKGNCQVTGNDIQCDLNDMSSDTQVPIIVKFTPTAPTVGSTSAQLLSNEIDTPQTIAFNYRVLRELTECEKNPTCACNPALCPVPPPPPADVALVIDDTGSMSEEINGVRTALSAFIAKLVNEKEAKPVIQLVTFKDNFTHRVTTDNLIGLRDSHVNRLTASGGDDCPENAGGALSWVVDNTASNHLKDGGRVLFITDASPHDGTDIDGLINKLRARGISVDVFLSDNSCLSDGAELDAIEEFSKMKGADGTGGVFRYFDKINDPNDAKAVRQYETTAYHVMMSSIFPTIIASSSSTVSVGSTMDVILIAANTNFNESTTVDFKNKATTRRGQRDSESGIIINEVTAISATELLVNITIPENVIPGFYDIIVETQLGDTTETAHGKDILEITGSRGEPEILSIMPTSALQDSEVEVTIYATHSHFNAGSQLSFANPGIKVKQMQIKSNTVLTAILEIADNAKLGLHHVIVMSGSETATSQEEKFLVIAESNSAKIKTLSASRGIRGAMVKFDITGKNTNFEEGVTELRFLRDITVLSFTVISPTEATATIMVDPEAQLGYQDVIMITGDEVAVKLNGFEVSERGPHAVEGYALDQVGEPVDKVYLAIKGQGVFTDATGYFRMTGLVTGEYTITSEKAGYHFVPETFVVGQPPAEVANVVLKAASAIAVEIKPDNWHPTKQGGKVNYTVTITNKGTEPATGIVLTDILPENTSLAAIEGGNCQVSTASCQLRDLGPNKEAVVKVTINNTQTRTLINTVTVTSNEYPPATVKQWKRVLPYLSVIIEAMPNPIAPEGRMHYTLDVDLSPYSPTPATDVQLVTRLPHGVELLAIKTDYGSCDTSDMPTIICDLVDLSLDNPDDVSHITVTMDAVLKDPGLLLLTHEAKVSANEYPVHLFRERTDILIGNGVEVDIAFVIDVTGSMQEEINAVVRAMRDFIAELDTTTTPSIALVIFRDEVTVKAFTGDINLLADAINDIEASGGGTCEEASIEALQVVIPHVKEGGAILFATDAAPYPDTNIQSVIEMLRDKGIRFNAMITGDCSEPDSWNELSTK